MQHSSQPADTALFSSIRVRWDGYTSPVEPWRRVLVKAWEDSRLTLDELSTASGLNRGTIHRILDGKTDDPGFNTIVKLAAAFGDDVCAAVAETIYTPRPGGSGHAKRRGHNPVLEERFASLLEAFDVEVPAEDTWRGDVLKAIAALNRALRRSDPGTSATDPQRARR